MARCDACKNDYDKWFQVLYSDGQTYTFDSFECAMHLLAPVCQTCGIRILGHGLESTGQMFCCDHCAERAGIENLRDRA
jgi:hypothetical protein